MPLVAGPIEKIADAGKHDSMVAGEIEVGNEVAMRTWSAWHMVRTLLVDVPALWYFAEDAALSFWVTRV